MNPVVSQFILAVDVGNSRIKFGLFARNGTGPEGQSLPECLHALAIPVAEDIPWNDIRLWKPLADGGTLSGIVAGANPAGVNKVVSGWPNDDWSIPKVIDEPVGFPITVNLDAPDKVGIDRLLNGVAANLVRSENRPIVIVDSGTATTVDLISSDGAFAGGAILPGFELASRALNEYTALLPYISIEDLAAETHAPVGKDTRQAISSGLFWGHVGAVRELITRMAGEDALVLLTGGGAGLLAEHLPEAQLEPHLALQGLVLVAG